MCVNPKYSLKRLIAHLPGKITTNRYMICIELEITERTLDNWCNTEKGDKFSIPSDQFLALAKIFKCEPSQLINGEEAK
jgi:hypothetical protein